MAKCALILAGLLLLTQCHGTETDNPAGPTNPLPEPKPLPEVVRSALSYDSDPVVTPATESALIGDLNALGVKLWQGLAGSDRNFVLSPVSGFLALTMTSAGARGITADEMKAVLYPSVPTDEIHVAANGLQQRIRGYARPPVGDYRVELEMAHDAFAQRGFAIEAPFLDTLAVNYDCGVELVDYQNDWETARVLINNWIANRTRERIQELFLPGILDSFTRLVLVDTLYLYASWRTAFDPNSNQTRTFHGITGDGSTDFMTTTLYLDYAAGEGWVGVDLPYYGDSLVLTAVLPDAGQFETVKASLGVTWLSSFDATSQPSLVGLTIPKFRLRSPTVAWDQALKDLGMTTLFDALSCNLEGISASKPLYVKTVVQQVYIELAEKGTEAAAATGVVINRDGGVPPPPQYYVVLDRPFLFFIRERGGPVLFAGQIVSLPVAN